MLLPLVILTSMFMQVSKTSNPTDPVMLTVAEASNYTQTATSAEVIDLIARLRKQSSIMRVAEMGKTFEGKPIPLMILANPPIESHEQVPRSGKPVVFVMANIHAGEIEGKEACLILARELALNPEHPLLKKLIIVFAPNYNADGNDKFDDVAKNRPGQDGPVQCGVRANSQGLDLNRDYIKLEAPETRALVKFLSDWNPLLTVDCHTTNGSHHRYMLTYEAPLNPSGHAAPIEFIRNQLLPAVGERVKERTGYDLWHYGNFNAEHTAWEAYGALPRFGGSYQGLRGQMSVLSEAYSYAPYRDRVIATTEFVRAILEFTTEHVDQMMEIRDRAKRETIDKGMNPQPDDVVGIRHRTAAFNDLVLVKGYEKAEGGEDGAAADPGRDLGAPKDFLCVHRGRFEPTLSVRRPYAYLIPPMVEMQPIIAKLREHGITVSPLRGNATCEVYTVASIERADQPFQGHRTVSLEVQSRLEHFTIRDSTHIVRTAQPLGTLAVYMLEPQSEDGLATWNFFDDLLEVGKDFPIKRISAAEDLDEHQ